MKNIKLPRKKIQKRYRTIIAIILAILTFIPVLYAFFFVSTVPGTTTENITICQYFQNGKYDYTAHLTENKVYDNKKTLKPGEGTIYKAITEYLDLSFSYNFLSDCGQLTEATYELDYIVQTDEWSKEYNMIPETKFAPNRFDFEFEINTSKYEKIVNEIDDEINMVTQNPSLNITCKINIILQTDNGTISESFNPTIGIPLKQNTIYIKGNLSQFSSKTIEDTIEIPISTEEINNERNNYLIIAAILSIVLILFIILTKNETYKTDKSEKEIQKIIKKYKEWIIEVEKQPKKSNFIENIKTKSIDDLIKTSEELGKPIVYYSSKKDNENIFYIIDNKILYEHSITTTKEEKDTKKIDIKEDTDDIEIPEEIERSIVELLKENVPYEGIISQVEYKNKKGKIETPSKSMVNKIRQKHIDEIVDIEEKEESK